MAATRTISSGSISGGLGQALAQLTLTFIRDGNKEDVEFPPLFFDASTLNNRLVDLSSGDNTITLNSATRMIAVLPPTGSSVTIKYGASGDTSIAENIAGWHVMTFAAAAGSTLHMTASGALTGVRIIEL